MTSPGRFCCCGVDGPVDPPFDPCPDWECDVLTCGSVACPAAVVVDASNLTLSIDAAFKLGDQPPSSDSVEIGGLVADQDDFAWVGGADSVVAICGTSLYARTLAGTLPDLNSQPDDIDICGDEADDQSNTWRRDPSSMGTPGFSGSAGTHTVGVMTPNTYYYNDGTFADPSLEGFYTASMLREIRQATVTYQLLTSDAGCSYIQQTVTVLLMYGAVGKLTGISSAYFPAPTDRSTSACLVFQMPVTYQMTRPVYCNEGAGICVPGAGLYGAGQQGPGVPAGIVGTASFVIDIGDGLSAAGSGPTLQANFASTPSSAVAGGTIIVS